MASVVEHAEYVSLEVSDHVALITLCATEGSFPWGTKKAEHRWNPITVAAVDACLDAVEADCTIHALVVAGAGKFWSNGLDLAYLDSHTREENEHLNRSLNSLMARVLTFPIPTVAALQGHWCAAGGMMGLTFDFRVMNSGQGYFFIPGVDLGIVYSPFQTALFKAKLPQHMHRDVVVLNAKRWRADDLLNATLVEATASDEAQTIRAAVDLAQSLTPKGKMRETMRGIKRNLYHEVLSAMSTAPIMDVSGRTKGVAYAAPPVASKL